MARNQFSRRGWLAAVAAAASGLSVGPRPPTGPEDIGSPPAPPPPFRDLSPAYAGDVVTYTYHSDGRRDGPAGRVAGNCCDRDVCLGGRAGLASSEGAGVDADRPRADQVADDGPRSQRVDRRNGSA